MGVGLGEGGGGGKKLGVIIEVVGEINQFEK